MIQLLSDGEKFGMICATKSVPTNRECYSFEIKVLNPSDGACCMEVGFTSKPIDLTFRDIHQMVKNRQSQGKGFEKLPHSYGYSSTGVIYDSFGHVKSSTRQIYGGGDVIRCYVDKRKLAIYFSKNGELQGKILKIADVEEPVFPTIVVYSNGTIVDCQFSQKYFEHKNIGKYKVKF